MAQKADYCTKKVGLGKYTEVLCILLHILMKMSTSDDITMLILRYATAFLFANLEHILPLHSVM